MYSPTEIKCTVPVIENGYVPGDIQEYKEHEVLHFECNRQYKRSEGRPSKCIKLGSGAEWSPTPVCECKYKLVISHCLVKTGAGCHVSIVCLVTTN